MKIIIDKIKKENLLQVIDLLQDVSSYTPKENYNNLWKDYQNSNSIGLVLIDLSYSKDKIIGFGSISFINKIRGGRVAMIEDIVIAKSHRRKKIGLKLIEQLVLISLELKCYKINLQCVEENINFYR